MGLAEPILVAGWCTHTGMNEATDQEREVGAAGKTGLNKGT